MVTIISHFLRTILNTETKKKKSMEIYSEIVSFQSGLQTVLKLLPRGVACLLAGKQT
jgi:hypothetical protein